MSWHWGFHPITEGKNRGKSGKHKPFDEKKPIFALKFNF